MFTKAFHFRDAHIFRMLINQSIFLVCTIESFQSIYKLMRMYLLKWISLLLAEGYEKSRDV